MQGGPGRILAAAFVVLAIVVVAVLLFAGGGGYRVTAEFQNAGQLVRGNEVKAGGVTVGTVQEIDVTDDGRAEVVLGIDDEDYAPLRRGTRAIIKQASLSGIANRYVDLHLGPDGGDEIDDGGRIGPDATETAVELDQVFALFDEPTRKGMQDFVAGQADSLRGNARELRAGIHYLNPALSTGSRLFEELTRDERLLEDFLVDSASLVNALAERRDDLTGVVSNLNATFGALGSQQDALAESVERLPPFMRRANTTFVNLRAALDDVDPLVDAAKPAVRRLGPFLDQARLFSRDAEPTIRDLSRTIDRPGNTNDLIELIESFPPLAPALGALERLPAPERLRARDLARGDRELRLPGGREPHPFGHGGDRRAAVPGGAAAPVGRRPLPAPPPRPGAQRAGALAHFVFSVPPLRAPGGQTAREDSDAGALQEDYDERQRRGRGDA